MKLQTNILDIVLAVEGARGPPVKQSEDSHRAALRPGLTGESF